MDEAEEVIAGEGSWVAGKTASMNSIYVGLPSSNSVYEYSGQVARGLHVIYRHWMITDLPAVPILRRCPDWTLKTRGVL